MNSISNYFRNPFVHILTYVDDPKTTCLVSKQWLEFTRDALSLLLPQYMTSPFLRRLVEQVDSEITQVPGCKIGDIDFYTLNSAKVIEVYKRVIKKIDQYPKIKATIASDTSLYTKRSPMYLEPIEKIYQEKNVLNSINFLRKIYDISYLKQYKDLIDQEHPLLTHFESFDGFSFEQIQACLDLIKNLMHENTQQLKDIIHLGLPLKTRKYLLEFLPEEIGLLPGLQTLTIFDSDVSLRSLPHRQLLNLTTLSFTSVPFEDGFSDFIDDLNKLPNLKTLSFHFCRMQNIPLNITQLSKLENLTFKQCQLTKFPWHVLQLPALVKLDISDNPIQDTPSVETVYVYSAQYRQAQNFTYTY
jgi:hypothetical protein